MEKILALDVSSQSTGYCVFKDGGLIKKSIGIITPDSKRCYGERLQYFSHELNSIFEQYKPNIVVMEDIYRGPNIKTFKILAMFRGVCFLNVFNFLGADPVCIMPTEARKIAGVGGVSKEDGFAFVTKKYKLKYDFEKDNDKADAIVLGLAYCEACKNGIDLSALGKKKRKKSKK